MREYNRQEVEEILRRDPEIVAIHWPPDWEFGEINRDLWTAGIDNKVRTAKGIELFLAKPCIEDTFGPDFWGRIDRKQKMIDGMTEQEGALWLFLRDHDALRYGNLGRIAGAAEGLFEDYSGGNREEMEPQVQRLRSITPPNRVQYDMLTTRQKIELVGQLKETAFRILQNFYMPVLPNYD